MPAQKIALAAVLGGLTLFLWGVVSHMVLPLYNKSLHKFTDEESVTMAIVTNTPHSGTYFLPYEEELPAGASAEQKKAREEKMKEQMEKGPMVFAHIRVGSFGSFGVHLAIELLKDILSALVVGLLLVNTQQMSLRSRVAFVFGIAVAVVLESTISEWNWYGAGTDYAFAVIFDLLVGWLLAGFVLAKVLSGGVPKATTA